MTAPASTSQPREALIAAFLTRAGWGGAKRSLLAGDASFRRYDRLRHQDAGAVLMDAPPPMERVAPYVAIAHLLRDHDFSAPAILAADEANGLLLIEDLGDDTYSRLLEQGRDERALYELATDVLIEIRRRVRERGLEHLPEFDIARAFSEVSLLLDWYWPAHFGEPAPAGTRGQFEDAWRRVLPHLFDAGHNLTLFDFHIDNLLLLPGREGYRACGLLDFQDAVRGPVPFDLASLLEDVRRDVPVALADAMIQRYLAGHPDLDPDRFEGAYAVSAAERNTRIAGTFARLLKRDGKAHYQRFMPRVWRLIEGDLKHPLLAPVAAWFDRYLPPSERTVLDGGG